MTHVHVVMGCRGSQAGRVRVSARGQHIRCLLLKQVF
jgi:hypothetical protein